MVVSFGADEGDRTLHPGANRERNDEERAETNLSQNTQVLLPVSRTNERVTRITGHDGRLLYTQYLGCRRGRRGAGGPLPFELAGELLLTRIGMYHGEAVKRAIRLDHVNDAPRSRPP